MSNPFLQQAKTLREKAEAFCRERRWAEAAEAYEDLAKAWIALAGLASTPGARADRMAEYENAMSKAAECRSKAEKEFDTNGSGRRASSPKRASAASSSSDDSGGDVDDGDSDGQEWPPDSLHAQLAGDQVGDMLIAQIEGFLRTSGVTWDDIGGQEALVADLKTILAQSVMKRPDGSRPR